MQHRVKSKVIGGTADAERAIYSHGLARLHGTESAGRQAQRKRARQEANEEHEG
jgi:hypothetical protein